MLLAPDLSIPCLTFYMEWRDVWRRTKCLPRCSPQEWIWDIKERLLWHLLAFGTNLLCWLKKYMDVCFTAGYRIDTEYRIQDTGSNRKVGGWLVKSITNQLWTSVETTSKWSSFSDNCKKSGHWSQILMYFQSGTEQFWHAGCLESCVHKSVYASLKNILKWPNSRTDQVFSNMSQRKQYPVASGAKWLNVEQQLLELMDMWPAGSHVTEKAAEVHRKF